MPIHSNSIQMGYRACQPCDPALRHVPSVLDESSIAALFRAHFFVLSSLLDRLTYSIPRLCTPLQLLSSNHTAFHTHRTFLLDASRTVGGPRDATIGTFAFDRTCPTFSIDQPFRSTAHVPLFSIVRVCPPVGCDRACPPVVHLSSTSFSFVPIVPFFVDRACAPVGRVPVRAPCSPIAALFHFLSRLIAPSVPFSIAIYITSTLSSL